MTIQNLAEPLKAATVVKIRNSGYHRVSRQLGTVSRSPGRSPGSTLVV